MIFSLTFVGGPNPRRRGPHPQADLDRGVQNLEGSKSAGTPAFNYVTCKIHLRLSQQYFDQYISGKCPQVGHVLGIIIYSTHIIPYAIHT